MDSFRETYNPISFIGALMGYLSYGHFLVCVTSFSHLYELFSIPCFLTQHFFSKSLLEAEKQNGSLLLTIDTIDARNIIIVYHYLGRTDRRGQKGKMLNPQIAILTVRNQFHFHYCALPIMHLLYPSPHPPPPEKVK